MFPVKLMTRVLQSTSGQPAKKAECTYCGEASRNIRSHYVRKLQDLPIQSKKVRLVLKLKKYFCKNKNWKNKTFAEPFSLFEHKATKTRRLRDEILRVSMSQSSLSAASYLRNSVADVGKSTICNLLKKQVKLWISLWFWQSVLTTPPWRSVSVMEQ